LNGIININKPQGITSFDVIRRLRRILKIKKIGHTGTLDPLATGVLVVCVGRATKLASDIEATEKTYIADFDFGYKTDTYDSEGKILEKSDIQVKRDSLISELENFRGVQKQIPPMYSALKVNGKKLYELAREGIEIERKSREINISKLELLDYESNSGRLLCSVSKGTYIRSLIFDIGENLKAFATMTGLKRTKVGNYSIENSFTLEEIEEMAEKEDFSFINSIENSFQFPKVNLEGDKNLVLFKNGNTVIFKAKDGHYRIYSNDEFLGLGEIKNERLKGYKVY